MIVTGILSGGAICKKLCSVQNINFYDFIIISAVAGGLGFAGAKIFFLIDFYTPTQFFKALGNMLFHPKASGLISGGFVFYGGLIGGIAGYFLGVKIARCGVSTFLNTFAFAIPFVHAFGRIGCFCAGCCYGIEYTGPLSVAGHFPVQLVEAGLLFVFAFVMMGFLLRHAELVSASLFHYYILYYSTLRFFLEFLRGDEARGSVNFGAGVSLSTSQLISLILFVADIILIVLIKCRKNDKVKQEEATETQND